MKARFLIVAALILAALLPPSYLIAQEEKPYGYSWLGWAGFAKENSWTYTPIGIGPLGFAKNGSLYGFTFGALGVTSIAEKNIYGINIAGYRSSEKAIYGLGVGMVNLGNHWSTSLSEDEINYELERGFGHLYGISMSGLDVIGRANGIQAGVAVALAYQIRGAQFSVFPFSRSEVTGIQVGGTPWIFKGELKGAQIGALTMATSEAQGLQLGLFTFSDKMRGVQIGGAWSWNGQIKGIEIGVLSTNKLIHGCQIGFLTMSGDFWSTDKVRNKKPEEGKIIIPMSDWFPEGVRGAQIGVINIASRMKGLQLGVINVAYKNKWPFFPGFLIGW